MSFVYMGTHATDDPTKAALPFVTAVGGKQVDDDVAIVLLAEAVSLVKDVISNAVLPVGFPPMKDLIRSSAEAKIPVYV